MLHPRVDSWPYLPTLDQGKHSSLLRTGVNHGRKIFYSRGLMRQKLSPRDNYRGRTKAGSNPIETPTLVFYTLA